MGSPAPVLPSVSPHPVFEEVVRCAVLAPSSHNTQPWHFRVRERGLEVRADRTRALPVNDPEDRELTISCGAALFNARVAVGHLGFDAHVKLCPRADDADLLATLELGEPRLPTEEEGRLYAVLPRRHTYRKAFDRREVPEDVLAQLHAAVEEEGAGLHVSEHMPEKLELAELVAEGDKLLWDDPRWRRELGLWMHPRRKGDGLTVPGVAAVLAPLVLRSFDLGNGEAARDRLLAERSPVIAVLWTEGDGVRDWMHAGQALERLLLVGRDLGLQASYLNQPIQMPLLRQKVQRYVGRAGFPQLLLRLGYPLDEGKPTVRRPVSEVLE